MSDIKAISDSLATIVTQNAQVLAKLDDIHSMLLADRVKAEELTAAERDAIATEIRGLRADLAAFTGAQT